MAKKKTAHENKNYPGKFVVGLNKVMPYLRDFWFNFLQSMALISLVVGLYALPERIWFNLLRS